MLNLSTFKKKIIIIALHYLSKKKKKVLAKFMVIHLNNLGWLARSDPGPSHSSLALDSVLGEGMY